MENKNEIITQDGEVIEMTAPDQSLAIGLTRAEIDQQIATARAYPRSIKRATDAIFTLATLDEMTAEECTYALPRGGKPITGPSIRLAEIIQQCWGNCRVAARVVHVDRTEKFVEAEGVYHDLETNSATMARVRRRIVDSKGRLYSDDMIIVTGNAACSIAKRNAILGGVPKPVWRQAEDAVRKVVAGTIETLVVTRDKSLKAFANYGVKPEQVFAAIAVQGLDDIGLDKIPVLRGMFAALKNGEATVEEMFSTRQTAAAAHQVVANPLSDQAPKIVTDGDPSPASGPKASTGFDAAFVAAETATPTAKAELEPAHDPETGEIAEEVKADTIVDDFGPVAGDIVEPEADDGTAAEHEVATTARAKAAKGANRLRLWAKSITPEEYAEHVKPILPELLLAAKAADDAAAPWDDEEAPAPNVDPALAAMKAGWDANQAQTKRSAIPAEYRTAARKAEADAWVEGWDKAKDAMSDATVEG